MRSSGERLLVLFHFTFALALYDEPSTPRNRPAEDAIARLSILCFATFVINRVLFIIIIMCVCVVCMYLFILRLFLYTRSPHAKARPQRFLRLRLSYDVIPIFVINRVSLPSSLCVFYLPSFCLLHTRVRHANAQSRRHLPRGDAIAKARAWRAFLSHARVSLCGSARLLTLCGCRRAFVPGHSRPGDANGARSDGRSRPGLEAPSATRSCYGPRLHYRSQRREDAAGRAYGSIVLFQTLYMCPII